MKLIEYVLAGLGVGVVFGMFGASGIAYGTLVGVLGCSALLAGGSPLSANVTEAFVGAWR